MGGVSARLLALVLLAALVPSPLACRRAPPPPPTAIATATAPAAPLVLAPPDGIRWTEPPAGVLDVAAAVESARARASAEGRTLVVYVGATWCEPCQRFHHAVDRGELDGAFPSLTVLAFDADRDGDALAQAGYASRLIPLFALPGADGRGAGPRIEGSVKGEEAVSEITPRLRALIAEAR